MTTSSSRFHLRLAQPPGERAPAGLRAWVLSEDSTSASQTSSGGSPSAEKITLSIDFEKGLLHIFSVDEAPAQEDTTAELLFPFGLLVADLSQLITLEPGDVIATGTPPGVGSARNPPILLKAGVPVAATASNRRCWRSFSAACRRSVR